MKQADMDHLEILAEQFEAISDLWELAITKNLEESKRSRIDELLLSIYREKIEELKQLDIGME